MCGTVFDVSLRGDLIADTVNGDAADSNKVTQGLRACKDVNRNTGSAQSSSSGVCVRACVSE